MGTIPDEKSLRKAWLLQKFSSYAYHEELLRLHQVFKMIIERELARPEARRDHKQSYDYFVQAAFPIINSIPAPGQMPYDFWKPGVSRGFIGNISDYGRYLAEEQYWEWMPIEAQRELGLVWTQMDQIVTNIRQTVDGLWYNPRKGNDDAILVEKYTGPITWPVDWREQVLGPQADEACIHVRAGKPVPRAGTYVALDPRGHRRSVEEGATLPDLNSPYGITVWQHLGD